MEERINNYSFGNASVLYIIGGVCYLTICYNLSEASGSSSVVAWQFS